VQKFAPSRAWPYGPLVPNHDFSAQADDLPRANCDIQEMARLVVGEGVEEGSYVSVRYAKGDLVVVWRGALCAVATRAAWQRALIEQLAATESTGLQALLLLPKVA
jgi:hypothetical protein